MKKRLIFLTILGIVATAELLAMVLLKIFHVPAGFAEVAFDILLLLLLIAPFLYFIVIRPFEELTGRMVSLMDNIPGMVYRGHRDWSMSFTGGQVEQVTGHAAVEFTGGGVRWKEMIHTEDLYSVKHAIREAVKAKKSTLRMEYRILHKDGSYRWIEDRRQFIYDEQGEFGHVDGVVLDVSDRKRSEEELRRGEDRYRAVVEGLPDVVMRFDREGRHLFVSDNVSKVVDLQAAQFIGKTHHELGFPEAQCRFWEVAIEGVFAAVAPFETEFTLDGKQGPVIYNWRLLPERDAQGMVRSVLSLMLDITERKRAEEEKGKLEAQLHQAMKMEAVGRLAGGVAHDFNNLLTVISGYSELLLQKVGIGSPLRGQVEEIKRAGERAAALTRQLLAFSRKQIIEPKVAHLGSLVAEMHGMLTRLIGEDIDLQTTAGKSTGSVRVDPGQFQQILMNLAVNARDAMPEGGKIAIETANVELDEGYCARHPYVTPGRYVMLSVSDTGMGMSEEVKAHIFEPFFTTKERGSGTGLGLATTHGIVKQAGGSIEAYSEAGKGTTFKIYLPRVEDEAAKPVKDDRPTDDLPGGTETVLVVEDEDTVRDLCAQILGNLGYKVVQAGNGAEAIAAAVGLGDRIDLLLTDVVMPGMSGPDLAAQLVLHRPGMKVLFMSGYTDDAIGYRGVLDEGVSFIGKPYSPEELARKVREVLGKD